MLPWPLVLSTSILPLFASTSFFVRESPRPVPSPLSFVVKKGSKILLEVFGLYARAFIRHGEPDIIGRPYGRCV